MWRLLPGECMVLVYRAVAHTLVVAQYMVVGLWELPYYYFLVSEMRQWKIVDRGQRLLVPYIHLMVWMRLSSYAWVH